MADLFLYSFKLIFRIYAYYEILEASFPIEFLILWHACAVRIDKREKKKVQLQLQWRRRWVLGF